MSDALQKPVVELPKFGEKTEEGFELPSVEVPDAPEQEPQEASIEEEIESLELIPPPLTPVASAAAVAAPMPIAKDQLTHQIEKILEEDLAELYFQMPAETQVKFKVEGERVTSTIRQILKSGIVKMKKILSLILGWLRMVPGVNKFFLEKEAKIKAEKILALHAEM